MHKKSKLLKSWTRTIMYLTAIAALVSFTGPLSAGWVYDGNDDNNGNPRRLVRMVFGTSTHSIPDAPNHHPDAHRTANQFNSEDVNVGLYMRNTLPAINATTHIEFWINPTVANHITDAVLAELGAQANAYLNAAPVGVLTFQTRNK